MRQVTIGVIPPGTLPRGPRMKIDIDHHPLQVPDHGFASKCACAEALEDNLYECCAEADFRGALVLVVMRGDTELTGAVEALDATEVKEVGEALRAMEEIAEELAEALKQGEAWVFSITVDLLPKRTADYH